MSVATLLMAALATVVTWQFPETKFPLGLVSNDQLKDQPAILWARVDNRLKIVRDLDDSRILRVAFPQGKWGSQNSGAQFMVGLPPQKQATCQYRVRFASGFDFAKGGKLPGLAGGAANTGLRRPDGDGWSARFMWRKSGDLVLYLYHMDQRGAGGDDIPLAASGSATRILPGQWMSIRQTVTVNDPQQSNGRIRVWINDRLALDRDNLRLRSDQKAMVDRFYFSTFFGGKGDDWAPSKDVTIDFDQIQVGQ